MKTVRLDAEICFIVKDVDGAYLKRIDWITQKLDSVFKGRRVRYRLKTVTQ